MGYVKLADSGPGMSADELSHVFDRFWRGTTATATAGSGIGLAVVYELVRAHRGTIETSSELGRGTTFLISLPRL
jgi:signal transduction histidine kinase